MIWSSEPHSFGYIILMELLLFDESYLNCRLDGKTEALKANLTYLISISV